MANWNDIIEASMESLGNLGKDSPEIMQALGTLDAASKSKKALDDKTRELIALAVAATTRCDTCISIHAKAAVQAGASRDELLEALAVAVAMNAGAAAVYSSRILEAFGQFGGK